MKTSGKVALLVVLIVLLLGSALINPYRFSQVGWPSHPSLVFEWHGETTDVTTGSPSGGSIGDTTATAAGSVSLSSSFAYDGTNSIRVGGSNQNYTFSWASSPAIVNPDAGTLKFRIYFTTIGDQMIFDFGVDANNRIYVGIDSGGYLYLRHRAGGTLVLSRTAVGILSTGKWYYVKCRWDVASHNGLYLNITCDETNGEGNSAYNGTDPLGTWSGTSGTVKFGDTASAAGVYYLDAIQIYDEWMVEPETYHVDAGDSGSTEDGTTVEPFQGLMAVFAGKLNRPLINPVQIRCRTSGSTADSVRVSDDLLGQMVTTSATPIMIVAETGHRAGTTWDDTKYHITPAFIPGSGAGTAFDLNHGYISLDGLQIGISSIAGQSGEAAELVYLNNGHTGYVANCHIKGSNVNNSGTNNILRGISSITGINVYNTIVDIRTSHNGNQALKLHGPSKAYSSLLMAGAGVGVDVADGSTLVAKNVYMQGDAGSFVEVDVGSLTQTTCATSDSLSTVTGLRNVAVNTSNFTNVTAGSENWALPSGSALQDSGTNTSGDSAPFNFITDINGDTRAGTWDIGPDQI